MQSNDSQQVREYLANLPPERRDAIETVRQEILANLPNGYVETFEFGMLAYVIPLEIYPKTYNGHPLMFAALASQKRHMSLYLMNIYCDPETERWFTESHQAAGKKLDMGKACIRFKAPADLAMDLIGQAIARTPVAQFIERYEAARSQTKSKRRVRSEKG